MFLSFYWSSRRSETLLFFTLRNPVQMNKNSKLGKPHSFEMCTATTSKITEYKNYTLSDKKTELQVAQMTVY